MIRLFYSTATASTSAHLALIEAGIEFERVEVSWERKLNLRELKRVNPYEAVPTLISSDGRVLTQNPAILELIADQAPHKKLIPLQGSWERREVQSWLSFGTADFQRSFIAYDEDPSSSPGKKALEQIEDCLDYIDQSLKGKSYLVGEAYTVADIHMYCCLNWCEWFEISFDKYLNIKAYRSRILERPAVQEVMNLEGLI